MKENIGASKCMYILINLSHALYTTGMLNDELWNSDLFALPGKEGVCEPDYQRHSKGAPGLTASDKLRVLSTLPRPGAESMCCAP